MSTFVISQPPADAAERHADASRGSRAGRTSHRARGEGLPPGSVVGSFVLHEVVEQDDFRIVYRASATASEADVLIEEHWPRALVERGEQGEARPREDALARLHTAGLDAFIAESEALAGLSHPALVHIGPLWRQRETAYRLRGDTARRRLGRELMDRPRPVDEAWLRGLAEALLGALEAVHQAGFVHGNVRLGGIVLRDDGTPLLLDFDAARTAVARIEAWRAVAPEPGHAAPELALYGVVPTPAADLYSLASVLWFCSTGELPEKLPEATNVLTASSRWDGVLRRQPSLRYSPGWQVVLDRALAFDPAVRPQDAAAFRRLLAATPAAPVTAALSQAPVELSAPEPVVPQAVPKADPPFLAAELDDSEPSWYDPPALPAFEALSRVDARPWPTRERHPMFDGPDGGHTVSGVPWERRPPAPPPRRHWPWALAGALVGGAAMLVFGIGVDRNVVDLQLARWFGPAVATVAPDATAALPGSVASGVLAMSGAEPPAAGVIAPAATSATRKPTASPQPVASHELPPRRAGGVAKDSAPLAEAPRVAAPAETIVTAKAANTTRTESAPPAMAAAAPPLRPRQDDAEPRREAAATAAADPAGTCAPRSNFALYWCMKTQCERSVFYAHPQCVALRREDQR